MVQTGETILWVSFGLQIFGALFATICYLPQAVRVIKTNDTRSISTLMFILTSAGCLLWIFIGIINMVGYYYVGDCTLDVKSITGGVGTIVSNLGLLSCGMIIFIKKLMNMRNAKKLGITEEEYYQAIGRYKHWKMLLLKVELEQEKRDEAQVIKDIKVARELAKDNKK